MTIRYEIFSRTDGQWDIFAYNDRTGEMRYLGAEPTRYNADMWLHNHTGGLLPDDFGKG